MTSLLALDLSLNSTGWSTGPDIYGTLDPTPRRGPERLSWVRDEILNLVHVHDITTVAIENYAYGRPNRAHQLGELGGVVRCSLYDAGLLYLEVSPSTVKRYATGKGNASKSSVLVNAVKRLGYDGDSTDEADALWIHAAVAAATGHPWADVPQIHREALSPIVASLEELPDAA